MVLRAAGSPTNGIRRSYIASRSSSARLAAAHASTRVSGGEIRARHVSGGGSMPRRSKSARSARAWRSSSCRMSTNGRTGPKASITFRQVARARYVSSSASRSASIMVTGAVSWPGVRGSQYGQSAHTSVVSRTRGVPPRTHAHGRSSASHQNGGGRKSVGTAHRQVLAWCSTLVPRRGRGLDGKAGDWPVLSMRCSGAAPFLRGRG